MIALAYTEAGEMQERTTEVAMGMDWKLELVPIPVSDVDRAKAFYAEKVGFNVDLDVSADNDHRVSDEMRVVQLTPPGSACSIAFGTGIVDTPPGSVQALHLVVSDINAARAELVERGIEVGEVQDLGVSCTPPSATRTGTAGPCSSCLISQARHRRRRRGASRRMLEERPGSVR